MSDVTVIENKSQVGDGVREGVVGESVVGESVAGEQGIVTTPALRSQSHPSLKRRGIHSTHSIQSNLSFLPARHKPFWEAFYRWFSRVFFNFSFHELILHKEVELVEKPVLLLGNHFSFHEGFWLYHINHIWMGKKFHLMMMEDELKERISLNKVGVFSVKKGSRSLIDSLNYTLDLLKQPANLVVIFPAGKIQSIYTDHVPFASGVGRILKKAGDIQVVFQAAFVDYSSERKPFVEIFFQEYVSTDRDRSVVEAAYNEFYRASRERHKQKIDADHT